MHQRRTGGRSIVRFPCYSVGFDRLIRQPGGRWGLPFVGITLKRRLGRIIGSLVPHGANRSQNTGQILSSERRRRELVSAIHRADAAVADGFPS